MNKEEIDNLENYLKNILPKSESTLSISPFGSVDLEDLMNNIKQLRKVPNYNDLLKENVKLKDKLEEKQKIIDDVANFIEKGDLLYLTSKCSTIYRNNIEVVAIYDRLKELLEILERGKDGI